MSQLTVSSQFNILKIFLNHWCVLFARIPSIWVVVVIFSVFQKKMPPEQWQLIKYIV
jgi:hypothetical protein